MSRRKTFGALVVVTGLLVSSTLVESAPRIRPSIRGLEGYATAVCLIQTGDAYLKDQGYRWSAIAVQGEGVRLGTLAPLEAAVKARVAQGGMVVVRDEASPTGDRPLPLVFCARIVDAPGVRAAIARAATAVAR